MMLSLDRRDVMALTHMKEFERSSKTFLASRKRFSPLQVAAHVHPIKTPKRPSPRFSKRQIMPRRAENIKEQVINTKQSIDYPDRSRTDDLLITSTPCSLKSPFQFSRGLVLTVNQNFCIAQVVHWSRLEDPANGKNIFVDSYRPGHIFEIVDPYFVQAILELGLPYSGFLKYDVHRPPIAPCQKVPPVAHAFPPNTIVWLDMTCHKSVSPVINCIIADTSDGQRDLDVLHLSFERPLCLSTMMPPATTFLVVPINLNSSLLAISGEIHIQRDGSIAFSRFDCLEFFFDSQKSPAVNITAPLPAEFTTLLDPGTRDRLRDVSFTDLGDTFSRNLVGVRSRYWAEKPFLSTPLSSLSSDSHYRIHIIVQASKNNGSKLCLSFRPDEDPSAIYLMDQSQPTCISNPEETFPQSIGNYRILKRISHGERGLVQRASCQTSTRTTRKCIIKRIKKDPESAIELDILRTLKTRPHCNCIEMMAHFEDNQFHYIIMDDLDKDLFEYIEAHSEINEHTVRHIFKQIVNGLYHLHHNLNIIHRDIKDENVMIDKHDRALLIDFGSAMFVPEVTSTPAQIDTFAGTIEYAAPEILRGCCYEGRPQDMWAMGVLLYTMIYRENPFRNPQEILRAEIRYPFQVSHGLQRLIQGLLNQDITKRLTVEQLKQDTWLFGLSY